jgi:preprotein translocase subunit SecG
MQQILLLVHVLIALILVVLVLLQQGKGAEVGASFGSGASQTIFGSQGSGSFMLRITSLFGLLFFVTSLALSYIVGHAHKQQNIINVQVPAPANTIQQTDTIPAQKS